MPRLTPLRTGAPIAPVLTLDELKAHLRIDYEDEDGVLSGFLASAIATLDGYAGRLGRCLVDQLWMNAFPSFCVDGNPLILFPGDVLSIVAVRCAARDGTIATLDPSLYRTLRGSAGDMLIFGSELPALADRADAVMVEFRAGYGAASDVPAEIKTAILLLAGHFYRNREAVVMAGGAGELPLGVSALVAGHVRTGVA